MRPLFLIALVACGNRSPNHPAASTSAPDPAAVVARWKGGELTQGALLDKLQGRLDVMEQEYLLNRYELMSQALDGAVDEALIEAEAKSRGLADGRALLSAEIEQQVEMPTEEELQAFYLEVQGQLRGAPYEQVQSMLAGELIQRRMGEKYQAFIADLRKSSDLKTTLPYPDFKRVELSVTAEDPSLGAVDAPVTIVQFAEYQCYYCAKVAPTLSALVNDYDGKVRVVFKDFPLENHRRAMPAAIAARCAGEQDRYWPMNELLLADQARLDDADFMRHASGLGLDTERFSRCLGDDAIAARVRAAYAEGERVGVQATPTFFVNGLLVSGAQPYDRFKAVIDQELARAR